MLILTSEQQQAIHKILDKGLIGIHGTKGYIGLLQGDPALNISKDEGRFLRGAMEKMGLLINHDGPNQNGLSELTNQGTSIAKSDGGYLGYLERERKEKHQQQQKEEEATQIHKLAAKATLDSTKWAKISGLAALIAIAISIYSLFDSKQDKAEANALKERIDVLERKLGVTKH
ncbi:hypothetical protein DNI29_23270 [Hymenobacter sediminis]|uniref:hypothetical protein n=1 Tax=Hymenobacter sediminis TaxID=2218621 RepID=UPI000DA6A34E|nr:hypothetical protein [Hymenobacter sediminis]RPD43660.1 hypothetical protein DNI29_23270 [Hymenobacter sediminis]